MFSDEFDGTKAKIGTSILRGHELGKTAGNNSIDDSS